MARRQAGSVSYLRRKIMKTPQLLTCFKRGFWVNLTDKVQYTNEGWRKRQYTSSELGALTQQLPQLYDSDKATVSQLLQLLHGNLFLTNAVSHEWLMLLDEELSRLFARENQATASDEEFFIMEDWDFDTSFDESFGSGSNSDDSAGSSWSWSSSSDDNSDSDSGGDD